MTLSAARTPRRSSTASAAAAAGAVAAAVLLAACGSGSAGTGPGSTGVSTGPSTVASASVTARPGQSANAPLTGLPAASAAALTSPIVVVDVGVLSGGAGLRGVGQADLVYQEFDNPGISRLIAAFQSQDAMVGPVAATAPVDARVVALMAMPILGFNGGPTGFVKQVGPTVATPRSTATFATLYVHSGSLVYVSTATLRASAPKAPAAPQGLLDFGGPTVAAATGAASVRHVTVTVPGQAPIYWSYDGTGWVGPGGVTVTNLVVQDVPYKALTSSKDPTVHTAELIGSGAAMLFGGGYGAAVTWSRPQPLKITNYFDSRTLGVALMPGRTWIILAPAGTKVTTS